MEEQADVISIFEVYVLQLSQIYWRHQQREEYNSDGLHFPYQIAETLPSSIPRHMPLW